VEKAGEEEEVREIIHCLLPT